MTNCPGQTGPAVDGGDVNAVSRRPRRNVPGVPSGTCRQLLPYRARQEEDVMCSSSTLARCASRPRRPFFTGAGA
ncbi:MAG: hypothetical protein MZV70_28535 [Desulfobacterales bacterium]|nr:hypothetical protein [Desulfobacterales bacterium]